MLAAERGLYCYDGFTEAVGMEDKLGVMLTEDVSLPIAFDSFSMESEPFRWNLNLFP